MAESVAEIKKHIRVYFAVFSGLLVLTGVTVAASYLDFSLTATIALALFIAIIKASLVACYFMHLLTEKKLILYIMLLTVVFFFVCLLLPTFWHSDIRMVTL